MGGGKGGGGAPAYTPGASAEGDAYMAMYPDVAASGMDPWYHYMTYGQAEGRTWGSPPKMEMPDFGGMMEMIMDMMGPDEEEEPEETPEEIFERERTAIIPEIDALYSERAAAATSAANWVNEQVLAERTNAKLLGLDYETSPEDIARRIDARFSSIWDLTREDKLTGLMEEWQYEPEGFAGFTVNLVGDQGSPLNDEYPQTNDAVQGRLVPPGGSRTILTEEEEEEDELLLGGSYGL